MPVQPNHAPKRNARGRKQLDMSDSIHTASLPGSQRGTTKATNVRPSSSDTYQGGLMRLSFGRLVLLTQPHCRQPRGVVEVDLRVLHIGDLRAHAGAHHRGNAAVRSHLVGPPAACQAQRGVRGPLRIPPRVGAVAEVHRRARPCHDHHVRDPGFSGAEVWRRLLAMDDNLANSFAPRDLKRGGKRHKKYIDIASPSDEHGISALGTFRDTERHARIV